MSDRRNNIRFAWLALVVLVAASIAAEALQTGGGPYPKPAPRSFITITH